MSELKPCPYCGGEAFVRIDVSLVHTQSRYRVGCDKDSSCHGWYGHSRYYPTEAEAIEAWNARAEYDKLVNFIQENLWHRAAMTTGAEVREQLADELYELGCEVEA